MGPGEGVAHKRAATRVLSHNYYVPQELTPSPSLPPSSPIHTNHPTPASPSWLRITARWRGFSSETYIPPMS